MPVDRLSFLTESNMAEYLKHISMCFPYKISLPDKISVLGWPAMNQFVDKFGYPFLFESQCNDIFPISRFFQISHTYTVNYYPTGKWYIVYDYGYGNDTIAYFKTVENAVMFRLMM